MKNIFLIITGLLLATPIMGKESIRGHFKKVGKLPNANSLKKVIYEEFMNFGCGHCNNLHKASKNFRNNFRDRVDFIDIPIVFRGQDDSPLRLYYVAKKIGKGKLIKDELFKTHFIQGVNVFDPAIINYLARSLGVNKEFQLEKDQDWVNNLISEGERKSTIYGITGTPTVVIQGAFKMDIAKYGTMSDYIKRIPETIDDLIE